MKCRHCCAELTLPFLDLGSAPPSNSYLTAAALRMPERSYPLRVLVCTDCYLVQTEDYAHCSEFFSADYAYFSSVSTSWLQHAEQYVSTMVSRFALSGQSHVVEVASNDGYLLQYVAAAGIPCLGIEPTAGTAQVARNKGLAVVEEFFGADLARRLVAEGKNADLLVANNVLAHVPDINDFVAGFALLLKPGGVATFEFPHLLKLVQENQFDTIYHEHYSYLSLMAVRRILERNGLSVFDVDEIPTHGGSLRVYAQRMDSGKQQISEQVSRLIKLETDAGMTTPAFYTGFQIAADRVKNDFVAFLIKAKGEGKRVVGYGAAAKGNTLLNYAGVRPDLISYVVDRNPFKQGKYLPGNRIPIVDESKLRTDKPDYIVLFPWNLRSELVHQLSYVKSWNAKLVTAIPQLSILVP